MKILCDLNMIDLNIVNIFPGNVNKYWPGDNNVKKY